MKLLIYRDSYEAVPRELQARPEVEPLIMEHDGTITTVAESPPTMRASRSHGCRATCSSAKARPSGPM